MFQAGCIGLRTSRSSNCLMCGVMPFLTSGEWSTGGLWMNLTWPDLTLAWFYTNGGGGTRLFQSHFLCFRSAQWVLLEPPLQLGVRPMATCWSLYFSVKLLITSTWKGFPSSWKKIGFSIKEFIWTFILVNKSGPNKCYGLSGITGNERVIKLSPEFTLLWKVHE